MADSVSIQKVAEFHIIELSRHTDGTFHVALTAMTVDEDEPQLLCQEIASKRVVCLDDALAVIKDGVNGASGRS